MVSCELTDVPRLMQKLAPSIWHVSVVLCTLYFVGHKPGLVSDYTSDGYHIINI